MKLEKQICFKKKKKEKYARAPFSGEYCNKTKIESPPWFVILSNGFRFHRAVVRMLMCAASPLFI